jgi:hypothetical protein
VRQASAVGLLVLLVGVVWLAMLAGWRRRAARQLASLDLPPLPPTPAEPGAALTADTDGVYVSTTTAGDWLERVTARGLGTRSAATMAVTAAGVSWLRQGAPDVFAATGALVRARRADGIAGKVMPPGGIVLVTWRLGRTELDTGFRPGSAADAERLVSAVERLAHAGSER